MGNFYRDNDDLRFYVEKALDWPTLVDAVERHYTAMDAPKNAQEAVETYTEILDLIGEFVAEEVAPRGKHIDEEGTGFKDGKVVPSKSFDEIFEQLKAMGVHGLTMPRELGGMNAPVLLYFVLAEIIARGDVSVMTHYGFHAGVATSLLQYSLKEGTTKVDEKGHITETRWQNAIAEILNGDAWGAMDLTEPQAGSDLAKIRAKAVKGEDGKWRITGNKIFITSGHGKYHFVLAKTEDKESLKALSLFMVPMTIERDGETVQNFYVDRVEEKIGHHGSATCSLQFEDAEGELIGQPGEGFKLMLMLMNNARIGVGFEGIGLAENAYRQAVAYADERVSMGKPIGRHEMIADYLDEMDITIKGLRALAMEGAMHEEMATRLEYMQHVPSQAGDPSEIRKEIRRHRKKARLVTPLLKYASAESAVWITRMNMQIHAGNGYTKDYDAERLLRDALVVPVYEGTSQIQALMALKDNMMDALKKPQRFLQKMARAKVGAIRAPSELERRLHALESQYYSALQAILLKIAKDKWSASFGGPLPQFVDSFLKNWDPKRDFAYGLLHAEHLTRILADVTIARILVDQAKRFKERREIAERWLDRAEPRVRYNHDLIAHTGDGILEKLRKWAQPQEAEAPVEAANDAVPGRAKDTAAA